MAAERGNRGRGGGGDSRRARVEPARELTAPAQLADEHVAADNEWAPAEPRKRDPAPRKDGAAVRRALVAAVAVALAVGATACGSKGNGMSDAAQRQLSALVGQVRNA